MHSCIVKIYGEPEEAGSDLTRLVIEADMVVDTSSQHYKQDAINAVVQSASEAWERTNPPAKSWRLVSKSRTHA